MIILIVVGIIAIIFLAAHTRALKCSLYLRGYVKYLIEETGQITRKKITTKYEQDRFIGLYTKFVKDIKKVVRHIRPFPQLWAEYKRIAAVGEDCYKQVMDQTVDYYE